MAHATAANNWFVSPKPNPAARLRLFCFPYAGGGAMVFWKWANHLPADVEVCLAHLPGRGTRLLDAPYTRLQPLVETIAREILPYTDKPFIFFGHSMGAIISFELARLLYTERGLWPVHLFVSGCRAPQIRTTDRRTYDWPEAGFVEDLRRLNGTPQEVLESPELMQLLMPSLRADFEVVQTYSYTAGQTLKCPVTVFGGLQDQEVSCEHLEGWREQTIGAVTFRLFPGDHFFIHSSQPLILQALAQDLERLLKILI
jgi:medium-chain acyl-[acyl-carrier-protein] hydrolase